MLSEAAAHDVIQSNYKNENIIPQYNFSTSSLRPSQRNPGVAVVAPTTASRPESKDESLPSPTLNDSLPAKSARSASYSSDYTPPITGSTGPLSVHTSQASDTSPHRKRSSASKEPAQQPLYSPRQERTTPRSDYSQPPNEDLPAPSRTLQLGGSEPHFEQSRDEYSHRKMSNSSISEASPRNYSHHTLSSPPHSLSSPKAYSSSAAHKQRPHSYSDYADERPIDAGLSLLGVQQAGLEAFNAQLLSIEQLRNGTFLSDASKRYSEHLMASRYNNSHLLAAHGYVTFAGSIRSNTNLDLPQDFSMPNKIGHSYDPGGT